LSAVEDILKEWEGAAEWAQPLEFEYRCVGSHCYYLLGRHRTGDAQWYEAYEMLTDTTPSGLLKK